MRGVVRVSVRTLNADDTFRDHAALISVSEWGLSPEMAMRMVRGLIDEAVAAAVEAERQADYAAGPKGTLP